jgi:hypothetical protein
MLLFLYFRPFMLHAWASAEKAAAWKELQEEQIQRRIKRNVQHIKEVIKLEGDNEYREGAEETTGSRG